MKRLPNLMVGRKKGLTPGKALSNDGDNFATLNLRVNDAVTDTHKQTRTHAHTHTRAHTRAHAHTSTLAHTRTHKHILEAADFFEV